MDEDQEIITKVAELKKRIGYIINDHPHLDEPVTLEFHEGMEFPKYRITIEALEEDFYVDAKGKKWKRVKEDE